MPQDLLTLKILAKELDAKLKSGKVQKINMPEHDEIRLMVFSSRTYNLVISCNPNTSRIHITDDKKENPYTAPTFCMLLRKHLIGAVILGIEIFNDDRIFEITFLAKNEMQDTQKLKMYVELMGRYSNIILVDESGKIIDSIVHIGLSENGRRVILPGVTYVPEKKGDKAELYDIENIKKKLKNTDKNTLLDALLSSINGLSKQSAKEIAESVENDITNIDNIIDKITFFNDIYDKNEIKACCTPDFKDYFVIPYKSIYDENEYIYFPSLNDAVNAVYTRQDKEQRTKNFYKDIISKTKKYRDKLVKKIEIARSKLLECNDMENVRISAELLSNNLYKVKRGDSQIIVENYYDEMRPYTIKLDVTKPPQQNVQALYNKYNKLKRAKEITSKQVEDYTIEAEYVNSILDALSRADLTDAENINEELINIGILKREKSKQRKKIDVKVPPKSYVYDGFTIYFGTNNIQNNEVTFKIGRSYDMWLHVKNHHGSHVIIRKNYEDEDIPENVIISAAETGAYYSSARDAENVQVDFADRKYVRRIPNAGIGMVNYTNYKTVFVNPKDNSK